MRNGAEAENAADRGKDTVPVRDGRMYERHARVACRPSNDHRWNFGPGDADALREIVARAVAANPKAVADFKKGKTKAADAIKGAVMRETKGMAKMDLVQQLVAEALANA